MFLCVSGKQYENFVFVRFFIHNQHFLPQEGESIIPHLLCCSGFKGSWVLDSFFYDYKPFTQIPDLLNSFLFFFIISLESLNP